MRRTRRGVEIGLPIAGAMLVLAAVLFFRSQTVQLAVVVLGLALMGVAIRNPGSPVLSSERRYVALRHEVDGFIVLVRRLNRATLALASESTPQNRARLLEVRDEMLESVKRMEQVAGKAEPPGTAAIEKAAGLESPTA